MDIDEITLGEIAEIEDYALAPFSKIAEDSREATRLRIGLAWILKRRTDPSFTVEDAQKLKFSEVMAFLDGDDVTKK